MGDVLGLGITHYPPYALVDEKMANLLRWTLEDPDIPVEVKDMRAWPEPMRAEYGSDGGAAGAARHRAQLRAGFERVHEALQAFDPEVVFIWGDDQYENYREDVIPPFSVLAYEESVFRPWDNDFGTPNVWDEPRDLEVTVPGHREAARYLTSALLESGIDMAYAYEPLHRGWGHAFNNTVMFMDHERKGWDYPTVGIHINCYGRKVVSAHGRPSRFAKDAEIDHLDPPSPSPSRCLAMGRAMGEALSASPWRCAVIASSSWSHAFLTDKNWRLYPDIESDRAYYESLVSGDFTRWHEAELYQLEESGQQEMLNWFCLLGAVEALDLTATYTDYVESYAFNSNKCFAIFE